MSDRRAHSTLFGFDFQVNAAIVLMLENIKELNTIKLEGNEEDIVITLNNNKKILAQAKAVENSSSDFRNVRGNLKKALETLSEGASKTDAQQLIFVTNSPNPFDDNNSRSSFWGPTHLKYADLPPSAKRIVDDYLSKIEIPLNPDNFMIQVFPFETSDEKERYKYVIQVINDFIGSLNANLSVGLGTKLLCIWQNDIFKNGTKKEDGIKLNKKSIIWPIIVLETDISKCDDFFIDQFDSGVYDEVVRNYGKTIDSCCEKFDFYTKVLYDFKQFNGASAPKQKCQEFVEKTWESYKAEFYVDGIDEETLEALTKIVLYNVVRRRITISNIKQGVNL